MPHKDKSTHIVNTIPEFIEYVIRHPNFKYARGESREYETPFLPKVWRDSSGNLDKSPVNENSTFTKGELDILKECQQLFLNKTYPDPYFERIIKNPKKEINLENEDLLHWAALAQHYGMSTRLVDITADLLVALYFSVKENLEDNGFVFFFRDNFNEIHTSHRVERGGTFLDIEKVYTDPFDKYPATPSDNTTSIIKPPFPNTRLEAQKGAFCFTKGINMSAYGIGGCLIIEIPCTEKTQIKADLEKIGYNHETLFPKNYNPREKISLFKHLTNAFRRLCNRTSNFE